jgi:hypothetical protein
VHWIQDTNYSLIRAEATADIEKIQISRVANPNTNSKVLMFKISNWQNREERVLVLLELLIASGWSFLGSKLGKYTGNVVHSEGVRVKTSEGYG